nr:MAG TPA: hypothetical protein [Caudoviricetes sp.]
MIMVIAKEIVNRLCDFLLSNRCGDRIKGVTLRRCYGFL